MSIMELRKVLLLLAPLVSACGDSPEGRTYFERNIQPILTEKCTGSTSGCHAIERDPVTGAVDPFAIAAGNLDVTSFENIQKRRDVLTPFGAYPYPLLLIKSVGPDKLQFGYSTGASALADFKPLEIQHSGGGLIEVGSDAYFTLQSWLDNGATENGLRAPTPAVAGIGDCTSQIPAGFDLAGAKAQPGFASFKATVQGILTEHNCSAGACHGAPQSDFFLTCGEDDDQQAFNFMQARAFVHDTGTPGAPEVLDSQLLRVPLAAGAGGRGHTGGDQFPTTDDPEFKAIQAWAETVGNLDFAEGDPLKQFFADPKSKGLRASLEFFPADGNDICNSSTYYFPATSLVALPDSSFATSIDATMPMGEAPALPAIVGTIDCGVGSLPTAPSDRTAIVLVTDGLPAGCESSVTNVSTECAKVRLAHEINTYVIGVGDNLSGLQKIAEEGGTTAPVRSTISL